MYVCYNKLNISPPSWVMEKKYELPKPYFPFFKPKHPVRLMYHIIMTEPEFKKNNIYNGPNSMSIV